MMGMKKSVKVSRQEGGELSEEKHKKTKVSFVYCIFVIYMYILFGLVAVCQLSSFLSFSVSSFG